MWLLSAIAGAVAVSVVEPSNFCGITGAFWLQLLHPLGSRPYSKYIYAVPGVVNLACTSSKVLVVFLWLNTGFSTLPITPLVSDVADHHSDSFYVLLYAHHIHYRTPEGKRWYMAVRRPRLPVVQDPIMPWKRS